jgi:spore coat protein CotH
MPTGNSFFFIKTITLCFFALGISFCYSVGYSQSVHPADNEAFIQNEVATVHISIAQNYLNNILHPDSLDSNTEYPATFIYSSSIFSDTVDTIGFRLRGNTSRYAAKKSFKIAFNSYTPGQKWKGLEKLNLNGEHNDPSILRSYISAYLLKSGNLPSPRNSYVELYINGEYKGLYYNNEHIDEEFIQKRFINNDDGNLFKANYGADLTYLGTNPNNYDNFYDDDLDNNYEKAKTYLDFSSDEDEDIDNKLSLKKKKIKYTGKKAKMMKSIKDGNDPNKLKQKIKRADEE